MTAATPTAGRGAWALLRDRTFGPYWCGNLAATVGMWGFNLGAIVLIFQITHSALHVALVTIIQFTVPVVLAPVGGAIADRFDRRQVIMASAVGAGVAVAALAAWSAWARAGRVDEAWPVFLAALAFGLALAMIDPARHAIVPALVPPIDLGQAVVLNSVTFNLGRAVGPAVAGVLLLWSGPVAVFTVSAAAQLLFALVLVLIRPRSVDRIGRKDKGIGAGFRYVWTHRRMLFLLIGIGAAAYGTDPVITLAPLVAHDLMAGTGLLPIDDVELAVGILAGAYGCGAVVAMLFVRRVIRRFGYHRAGVAGLSTLALMIAALAAAPELLTGTVVLLIGGVGYFIALTSLTTLVQMNVPEHLRGRVMALWGVFFLGSRPLAAFVDGALANILSLSWVLATTVVVLGVCAACVARFARL